WWGNACVDWPEMFEFFERRRLPARALVREIEFRTAGPGVSAWCHWAGVAAQHKAMQISKIEIRHDTAKRTFAGKPDNVPPRVFDRRRREAAGPPRGRRDGRRRETAPRPLAGDRLWLEHDGKKWRVTEPPSPSRKGPQRYGPFREVFRNRMLFVYGTKGTAAEN